MDERPAGFALLASSPLVDGDMDRMLTEFFLFHPCRDKGLGRQAAKKLFDTHKGSWELSAMTCHSAAVDFWKAVLPDADISETVIDDVPMTAFSFSKA